MERFFAAFCRVGIWGVGPIGKGWAMRLLRRGVTLEYFIDLDPRKIGKCIHGALVVAASEVQRLCGVFLLVVVVLSVVYGPKTSLGCWLAWRSVLN